jgi:DNA-binding response OmpR family regulator
VAGGVPRVLVVDDDPVILKLLQVNFEMEGFEVLTAADGADGLAAARATAPDVIVTDVMMPNMDGFAFLSALREEPATQTTPVIIVSAKAQTSDRREGLDAGADDYLTKPFEPLELVERVTTLLDGRRPGPQ